ncbi:MAG TPA: peptide ABC transporter substrate-binding protein [bacterium]|nr:peptide ABC transporter substrate-binding protein [bacterium]
MDQKPLVLGRLLLSLCCLIAVAPIGHAGAAPSPGTFVMAVDDNPDNLNPYLHSLAASSAIFRFAFDSLYTVNFRGEWEPALATRYTVSADGLIWTFTLRPGVRWSDGQPFTSADVKFTWELVTNKDVHITYASGFDKIESVDTPGPLTVVYHLKEPYAPFRDQVVGSAIVPKHVLGPLSGGQINRAPFNYRPVGTGPFYVSEFVADDHVTLLPNPYYWKRKPQLERLVVRVIPDQNTQVNLLRAGDLSLLTVPAARLDEVKRIPNIVIKRYLDATYALVQLDEYEFLREVAVRQALDYATPKESIIRNIMKGQAEPAVSDMVPNGPWANKNLHPRPYDPARARALLLQEGFRAGPGGFLYKGDKRLEVPLWTISGRPPFGAAMELIAQSWREIGVYTDTHAVSAAALFGQNGPQWNGKDAALIFTWGQGVFPENKINWHTMFIPKDANSPGENDERYSNPEMDRLLEDADRTVDQGRRHAIYNRVQELEFRDVPIIFLFWLVNNNAITRNVQGYDVTTFNTTPPEEWSTR